MDDFTPTQWDGSNHGWNSTIAQDGLTVSLTGYYENVVRSQHGVYENSAYWELALTKVSADGFSPRIGVQSGGGDPVGKLWFSGQPVVGDVVGVAASHSMVGGLRVIVTLNGVQVADETKAAEDLLESEPGFACISDSGGMSDATIWVANFGQEPFVGSPPAGFTAGLGSREIVQRVASLVGGALGTPTIDYPPIVRGISAGELGRPGLASRHLVAGLPARAKLGKVSLIQDFTGEVRGITAGELGTPSVRGGVSSAIGQTVQVHPLVGGGLGRPTAKTNVSVAVRGLAGGLLGRPVLLVKGQVTGLAGGQLGQPAVTQGFPTQGLRGGHLGRAVLTTGHWVQPIVAGRLGAVRVRSESVHEVDGLAGGDLGGPTCPATPRVFPLVSRARFGRPVLGGMTC